MKKVWKRALACMLVLAMVAGYFPANMNSVVNAEDSNAPLEFGKTDTYLQLSNPLSAAPQAIEATVNMPEIEKEWTLCAADNISVKNATSSAVQTVEDTVIVGPKVESAYMSITMPSNTEFVFEHKFNDVKVPYTWTNEDMALAFWMYSDKAVTLSNGNIELTSSGTHDHNEIDWAFAASNHNVALKAGWNYVELPLNDMRHNTADNEGSEFNLQELNYFRWHSLKFDEDMEIRLTDMKLVVIEEEENYGTYADGEWTIVDVDGTIPIEAIGQGSASKPEAGSNALEVEVTKGIKHIDKDFVSSMTIPDTYNLKGTASDDKMSGEDADNLYVDFWLYAPVDAYNTWFRLCSDTSEILRYGFHTHSPSIRQGWNHIQIPLSAFIYDQASDSSDFSNLNRVTFTAHGSGGDVVGTYYFSDIKIIDTDILEVSDYADGDWTIAEIGDTDVSVSDVANAENGPGTGTKILESVVKKGGTCIDENFVSSMTIPADYDLLGTASDDKMSGEDADNLYVDFWLYAPTNSFSAWFRLHNQGTEILRYGLHLASIQQGWNHMQIPLNAFTYVPTSDGNDFSILNRIAITAHGTGGDVVGTYYFSDIKIIDTDILESLDCADGEWTIAEIGNTEATGTNAPKGSKVVEKDVKKSTGIIEENVSCQLPSYYDLEVTGSSKPMSGDDVDNLMLDFWVCTPSEYSAKNLGFWLYMYYGDTNDKTRLDLNLGNNTSVIAGWNHIQVPMSAFNSGSDTVNASKITDITKVKFVSFGGVVEGTYFFSDIKIIDTDIYTPVEESTYDGNTLNYMIFSNLNATSEANQSALFVTKTGNPAFVWGNKQYTLNHNVCTGEDVKIKVVRFASGNIQFYINDEPVGMSVAKTTALNAPTTAHCIGGDVAGKQIMNGSISNLKVYSDATLSTCIGNWELTGNIQNVTGTMSDSSANANTAVFRGSRADDWSDYEVPEEILGDKSIISCDEKTDLRAGSGNEFSITTEKGEVQEGTGACKTEGNDANTNILIAQLSNSVDISKQQEGEICFWMYIQEGTSFGETLTLEIGSGGNFDQNEYQWSIQSSELKTGEWNQVYRKFEKASVTGGEPNMEAINWVRFYSSEKLNGTVIIDDIKAVMPDQPWSLVYIPDMENLTSNDTYNATWKAMAQWIADNAETENIQHVIGGGDTTTDNSGEAYARAMEGYQLFMNDVSWSTMVGLNDYADYTNRDATEYQTTFSDTVIKASAAGETYIGSYEDAEEKTTTENSYYRFSVNGVKWMILQLEYAPRTEVLEWADGIAKEYPLDNIILTTPGYLNGYGSRLSMGTTTWNALSDNQNIKMILCGHSTNGTGAIVQATETYSDDTGSVPVLMMNAQDLDAGDDAYYTDRPLGMISILRFSADGTKAAVQYYSPTEGKSFSPDDNFGNANSNSITFEIDTEVCTPIITPYGEAYDTTFEAATAPNEADIPTGYIFAGWFTDEACTSALKKGNSVTIAYAKFVDAEVLSVKAQSKLDKETDLLPEDMTDIRFVTTVDSTKYKEVGFEITAKHANGSNVTHKVGSEDVYGYLYAVGMAGTEGAEPEPYSPADICSPQSTLFKTFTIKEIKQERYGEEFTIRAYWITQDGTTVYGDTSVKTVEAGEP